jgi:hypothetical protein
LGVTDNYWNTNFIASMTTTESRHEFEEWVITKLEYSVAKYKHSEEYLSDSVEVAWEAWQAARERVTEQRDRLAEALKSIASGAVYEDKCILIAREALQSLTTNEL